MAIFAAASVLIWGLVAEDGGFRPTAPAALIVGLALALLGFLSPPRSLAFMLAATTVVGAVALLVVPAGESCDLPVTEFVSHTFEDAAGPHGHDRCQLESDRRSIAALALAAGSGGAIVLLIQQPRQAGPAPSSREG